MRDDWTACAAAGRAAIGSASPTALRLARARLLRGNGDRPGRVGLRALLTVDAAVGCRSGGSSVRPCAACTALRTASARPGS